MNCKYYTPEIEEFHIGFEYMYLDPDFQGQADGNEWKSEIFDTPEFQTIIDNWRFYKDYRVKYLDSEDVKSFGFYNEKDVYSTYNKRFVHERDERTHYRLGLNDDNCSIFISIVNSNTNKELAIIFTGKIKNKSELKKLLIQLNIINE